MNASIFCRLPAPRLPGPIDSGAVNVSLGAWLSLLSVAVVVLLMAGDLWVSLLALAGINASSFFVLLDWLERT